MVPCTLRPQPTPGVRCHCSVASPSLSSQENGNQSKESPRPPERMSDCLSALGSAVLLLREEPSGPVLKLSSEALRAASRRDLLQGRAFTMKQGSLGWPRRGEQRWKGHLLPHLCRHPGKGGHQVGLSTTVIAEIEPILSLRCPSSWLQTCTGAWEPAASFLLKPSPMNSPVPRVLHHHCPPSPRHPPPNLESSYWHLQMLLSIHVLQNLSNLTSASSYPLLSGPNQSPQPSCLPFLTSHVSLNPF